MWGKRKNKERETSNDSIKDRAALGIAKAIKAMQNRFGATLNKRTANLTQRGKIIFLIVFCIVFGGGSIYIIIDELTSSKSPSLLKAKSISVPKYIDKTGNDSPEIRVVITERDIKRIKQFRKYMDSLKTSNQGRIIHDSIIKARPGLMDSLTEVERLYVIDSSFSK